MVEATTPKPTREADDVQLTQIGMGWFEQQGGGLNRYVFDLHPRLRELGTGARLLVMGDPTKAAGVLAVERSEAGLMARWRALRRGFKAVPRGEVVASHFALYALAVRRKLSRTPHVVHFHGPWAAESGVEGAKRITRWVKHWLERTVYRTGDRFVTLSHAFAKILAEQYGVDPARIRVVPGGVDVERFETGLSRQAARERLGWDANRPTILCVRRLVRRMGLEQAIEAMRFVREKTPAAQLLIAGKGPLSETLQEQIDRLGLKGSVRLLGFVPDDDLPIAYRAADLSLVPTQSLEGFGLIITESLAAGTPALVTPVGGMPEVVRDLDRNLVLCDSSIEAITEGLSGALDGSLILPTGESCQAYARERFAWPVIADRILDIYREAAGDYE